MVAGSQSLRAQRILDELKGCGVTHVVWLPDSEARFMYDAILSEPSFTLVPVAREGECIGIALDLLLGDKSPIVLHQNTGFFEAGDSVRGLALDLHLPLLLMIGYRGYVDDVPMTDSAGFLLEPALDAMGIKHYLVNSVDDAGNIAKAYVEAQEMRRPVAVLIGKEYD